MYISDEEPYFTRNGSLKLFRDNIEVLHFSGTEWMCDHYYGVGGVILRNDKNDWNHRNDASSRKGNV